MFIHNLNPVLLKVGFFELRYYSLAYIIGFLLGYLVLHRAAKAKNVKNLDLKAVDDFMLYLILGVIIGGRVGHFIFYEPSIFWTNPLEIFFIWHGGMAFHGGLIGGLLGYYLFSRKHKIAFYDLADLLMMPFAFALFLGRIANFINGELWGIVTDVPWCVYFQGVEGCRHPSQLYEAFYSLLLFFILWFIKARYKLRRGTLFWSFILLYGIFRFVENFWRDVDAVMGQALSLVMVVVAAYFFYHTYSRKK